MMISDTECLLTKRRESVEMVIGSTNNTFSFAFTFNCEGWATRRFSQVEGGKYKELYSQPFLMNFTGWCDG